MVAVSRQPTKLDYASPTQFKFSINQLPKVEFFTVAANIPDLSLSDVVIPTPFKQIPVLGQNLTYGNLSITFIVDEFLENYRELHNWLTAIGFPKSREQFKNFRTVTSTNPSVDKVIKTDIGAIGKSIPDSAMFSDGTITILSNKNNPIVEVRFSNMYPVSLGALEFNQQATDVEYMTVSADFTYQLYEIHAL